MSPLARRWRAREEHDPVMPVASSPNSLRHSTPVGKPAGLMEVSETFQVKLPDRSISSRSGYLPTVAEPEESVPASSPAAAAAAAASSPAPTALIANPDSTEGFERAVVRGPLGWRIQFKEVHLEAKWRR